MNLDLVYPLKEGGRADDNLELRLSLRSVEANLRLPIGDLYVIGFRPPWLGGAVHVRTADGQEKALNLRAKYARMVDLPNLSDPFLLLDDDHLFLRETTAIPLHTWGDLLPFLTQFGQQTQAVYMRNAYDALVAAGAPTRNYQVHYPLLIRRAVLAETVALMRPDRPMVMGSVYGNLAGDPTTEITDDFKINWDSDFARLRGGAFASVSERGMRRVGVRPFLLGLFGTPSRWETGATSRSERLARRRLAASLVAR